MQLINTYAYIERIKHDRFDVTFNYNGCGYTLEDIDPMRTHDHSVTFDLYNTTQWKKYEINPTISTQ